MTHRLHRSTPYPARRITQRSDISLPEYETLLSDARTGSGGDLLVDISLITPGLDHPVWWPLRDIERGLRPCIPRERRS